MANSPPSIKDNPFKRLDALRNKVSGVKAPAPAAAAPPVPARRPSDASTAPAPPVDGVRGRGVASTRMEHISSFISAVATFNAVEALGQLSLKPGSVVIRHTTDGDWCEVTDCSTGKRGRVPASAIQEVRETTGAAPPTTAPEKKKGYTYSSLPALTGGPKRKIYKQPKKR